MPTAGPTKQLEDLKNSLVQVVPEAELRDSDYSRCGYHLEVRLIMRGMRRVAREMKEQAFFPGNRHRRGFPGILSPGLFIFHVS